MFDMDPYMVSRARRRLTTHDPRPVVWVGDASAISVPDSSYDAVFDFGIIHHVPDWRGVLMELFCMVCGKEAPAETAGRTLMDFKENLT